MPILPDKDDDKASAAGARSASSEDVGQATSRVKLRREKLEVAQQTLELRERELELVETRSRRSNAFEVFAPASAKG
jgi:hypothetical protein